jgi:alginate O-acetyltransferase complex protein AlgI
MAIGLSRLFGVKLPLNFNSPYKSTSISEFWRRWHMTLSRFLRDYLYIPLGGNRKGPVRRYGNLMTTMLLGGLWHGAGWTYVVWGGLHGFYLVVNHAWQALRERLGFRNPGRAWGAMSVLLTFLAVVVAWVFFRAANFRDAVTILEGMTGRNGFAIPQPLLAALGSVGNALSRLGMTAYLGGGQRFIETYAWTFAAALIAFFAPNTQQIVRRFEPALDYREKECSPILVPFEWRPTALWAACAGLLGTACFLALNRPTEFLYFQF